MRAGSIIRRRDRPGSFAFIRVSSRTSRVSDPWSAPSPPVEPHPHLPRRGGSIRRPRASEGRSVPWISLVRSGGHQACPSGQCPQLPQEPALRAPQGRYRQRTADERGLVLAAPAAPGAAGLPPSTPDHDGGRDGRLHRADARTVGPHRVARRHDRRRRGNDGSHAGHHRPDDVQHRSRRDGRGCQPHVADHQSAHRRDILVDKAGDDAAAARQPPLLARAATSWKPSSIESLRIAARPGATKRTCCRCCCRRATRRPEPA